MDDVTLIDTDASGHQQDSYYPGQIIEEGFPRFYQCFDYFVAKLLCDPTMFLFGYKFKRCLGEAATLNAGFSLL